jgi:hypothetical protein
MKKSIKTTIAVIIGLLLIVFADCAIGIKIGGMFGWRHLLWIVLIGFIYAGAVVYGLFRNEEYKTDKRPAVILLVVIAFFILSFCSYRGLNYITADSEYTEYEVTVIDIDSHYTRGYPFSLLFESSYDVIAQTDSGDEVIIPKYDPIFLNEDEGDRLLVKEYNGGFGIKIYETTQIKK